MAHFAKVENGIVTDVIVVANSDCANGEFPDSEPVGQAFLTSLGLEGEWKQTSYNNNFRGRYAGIGYTYNADVDVFVAPQLYSSWTLDENHDWQPPTPKPEGNYAWFEPNQQWIEMSEP